MSTLFKHYGVKALFISAAGLLAYEPILWLINTWFDPSYDSTGFTLFLVTGALFIWSLTSPQINRAEQNHKLPILLLFISR